MNKAIWVLQAVTALAFLGAGGMKLSTPGEDLRQNPQMGWATEFSDGAIKAIGAGEVAGGVGLIVPAAIGVAPMLTPVAGGALAALMGGTAYTHLRRGESPVAPLVLGALALAAAVLRLRQMKRA